MENLEEDPEEDLEDDLHEDLEQDLEYSVPGPAGRPGGQFAGHTPWPGTSSIRHIFIHTQIIRLTLLNQIVIFWVKKCDNESAPYILDPLLRGRRHVENIRKGDP